MQSHRIRTNPDGIYLELEDDRWIPIMNADISHDSIHDFINEENAEGRHLLSYATRAFHIGMIPDWEETVTIL